MIFTFIATLALPLQYAVFLGVLLSILVHVFRSAERVEISEIVPLEGGRYEERPAPKELPSRQVIALFPRGSLFFAGAAEFEDNLPAVGDAQGMVVVLGLRGRNEIGSTFLRIIERYAESIKASQGKLVLAGVGEQVYTQLEKTGVLSSLGSENVYRATSILGESADVAIEDARQWLASSESAVPPEA